MTRAAILAITAVFIAGCSHSPDRGVLDRVQSAEPVRADGGTSLAAQLEDKRLVAVSASGHDFQVQSREAVMQKFPCVQCHKVPLAQMKHDGKDGKTSAHWNIQLQHAVDSVMNCSTCHSPDDLNKLRTLTGKPVSLDQSWQVCSQCHFKQAEDWAGGAHGKRVAGWAPPRVSKTCAECHNAHRPAWDNRIPVHVSLSGLAGDKERD
jgi:hypothetical protein